MFATEMAPRSVTLSVNWMVCSKTLFEKYGPLKKGLPWFIIITPIIAILGVHAIFKHTQTIFGWLYPH